MRGLALYVALLMCAPTAAEAAMIVSDYSFTGTYNGTFQLSRDSDTNVVSLTALDLTINGFHYDPTNSGAFAGSGIVYVGGNSAGVTTIVRSTRDFLIRFLADDLGNVTFNWAEPTTGVNSGSITLTLTGVSTVPEPASWALATIGFGACGVALRRRPCRAGAMPA